MSTPDWLPELSDDDLATLSEALEAWELKDQAGEMLGDMMEGLLTQERGGGVTGADRRDPGAPETQTRP